MIHIEKAIAFVAIKNFSQESQGRINREILPSYWKFEREKYDLGIWEKQLRVGHYIAPPPPPTQMNIIKVKELSEKREKKLLMLITLVIYLSGVFICCTSSSAMTINDKSSSSNNGADSWN